MWIDEYDMEKWCDEKIKIEDLNMETQHITYEKNYKIIITS